MKNLLLISIIFLLLPNFIYYTSAKHPIEFVQNDLLDSLAPKPNDNELKKHQLKNPRKRRSASVSEQLNQDTTNIIKQEDLKTAQNIDVGRKYNEVKARTSNDFDIIPFLTKIPYLFILAIYIYIFTYPFLKKRRNKQKITLNQNFKSNDNGDMHSQYNLGIMYYKGEGVTQNYSKAAQYFIQAANQGYVEAQFALGSMYDKGEGVTQNHSKAAQYFTQAANQGHPQAQLNIGIMYYKGEGVTQNYSKAIEYLTKAANQGHVEAKFSLGTLYQKRKGFFRNYSKSIEYLTQAANQGHAEAQYALGAMYTLGRGVPQDIQRAKSLFKQSCLNKYQPACDAYAQLNQDPTSPSP